MGVYLNPGFENFRRMVSADIYVDKTMMIAEMNRFIDSGNSFICMSRPRRFGKTIASNMLCAYYVKGFDTSELFARFKISKDPSFSEKLNKSKDDVFAFLIHLGYLAYNLDDGTCIHVTSNRGYNNEDALGSAIYLAYIYALNDYTCVREMTAGNGFADVVYIPVYPGNPDRPAMIIELKQNDSPGNAIDQINSKKCFKALEHYQGQLLFVGIDYDEKEKTHSCKIQWFSKGC